MNEAFGPEYTDGTYTLSAKAAVDKIRIRAGMPVLPSLTKEQFTERIRNERRVEFAFEGQRFWDIRRWKIGNQTKDIYGLKITRNEDKSFDYKKILVEPRKWEDKMYLYPISNSERFKNTNLEQNPGW